MEADRLGMKEAHHGRYRRKRETVLPRTVHERTDRSAGKREAGGNGRDRATLAPRPSLDRTGTVRPLAGTKPVARRRGVGEGGPGARA